MATNNHHHSLCYAQSLDYSTPPAQSGHITVKSESDNEDDQLGTPPSSHMAAITYISVLVF